MIARAFLLFFFKGNAYDFGVVEKPKRNYAVSNTAAYYHCRISHFVNSLGIFREKALIGRNYSADKRKSELSAVSVTRQNEVNVSVCAVIGYILRFVS